MSKSSRKPRVWHIMVAACILAVSLAVVRNTAPKIAMAYSQYSLANKDRQHAVTARRIGGAAASTIERFHEEQASHHTALCWRHLWSTLRFWEPAHWPDEAEMPRWIPGPTGRPRAGTR